MNTVRGTYRFQGRQFEILRDGRIGFSGTETAEIDPLLDLQARRVISGIETTVHVRGTMRSPELVLEYQITDFLRLRASSAQGDSLTQRVEFRRVERAGLDLIFFFSY